MKLVFVFPFILALFQYVYAVTVCNTDVSSDSTLKPLCKKNDAEVLWPNYDNPSTYYRCINAGNSVLANCPQNTYFTYYQQMCTQCDGYIPPPPCDYLQNITDVTCIKNTKPTVTTKAPTVKPTNTTKAPLTTKSPQPTKTPTKTPSVPSPPSQGSNNIPTPPMVVTPAPGVPTPPSENLTPPSIPGVPPILTTMPSDLL